MAMAEEQQGDARSEEAAEVTQAPGPQEPAAVPEDDTVSAEPTPPAQGDTAPEEPALEPEVDAVGEAAAVSDEEPPEEEPALPPHELRAIVEALVFASPQPVTPRQIGQVLAASSKQEWQAALDELRALYAADDRGLQLVEVAGGYQITTRPEYNDWVRELLDPKAPARLSIQALETLAVIAYKQPVTLPEVIELRGVKSGGVVKTLLEKRLIRIVGRKEVVGRPMLYGTTKDFLLHFGLKDLTELPKIEEFAEVLGEEVDVAGLKKAIETPSPVDVPLGEPEPTPVPPLLADAALDAENGAQSDGPSEPDR
jgi:segregation and condensation protein B